jgi:hypothetical protein
MIVVKLKGGLGNQMFQYAAGRRLAETCNTELKLDLDFLKNSQIKEKVTLRQYELSIFNIVEKVASRAEVQKLDNIKNKVLRKYFPSFKTNPYVKEKYFQFDPAILNLKGSQYLDGHWMSEKYFKDVEPVIRSEFTFKRPVLSEAESLQAAILSSNSICMQIRRGDYITNSDIARVHGVASLMYFEKAIAYLTKEILNPVFFIFSDDSDWCIENFKHLDNACFVEKELGHTKADNSDYLQLMSQCKYFIISNSTFGWWGAWLSTYRNKIVIAPKNWFNINTITTTDIYPSAWMKM